MLLKWLAKEIANGYLFQTSILKVATMHVVILAKRYINYTYRIHSNLQMTKFTNIICWPVLQKYFQKMVEIILQVTSHVPTTNFIFKNDLSFHNFCN